MAKLFNEDFVRGIVEDPPNKYQILTALKEYSEAETAEAKLEVRNKYPDLKNKFDSYDGI